MDIRVTGIYGLQTFMKTEKSKTDNYAVISVFDDDKPFVHGDKPHLHMFIHDIDEEIASNAGFMKHHPHWKLFDDADAWVIKHWVEQVKDSVDYFIIHCHAGVSRSRAVAAALCFVYNDGDDAIHFEKGIPNAVIYKEMLAVYGFSNKYPLEFDDEIVTETVKLMDEVKKMKPYKEEVE